MISQRLQGGKNDLSFRRIEIEYTGVRGGNTGHKGVCALWGDKGGAVEHKITRKFGAES